MAKVQTLAQEVVSKIAAGEVIERPASVIKEAIENSLDAKAKTIEVNLKQAGKTSIQIKDSGEGIENEDIEKIFLRHSTSKIKEINDLYNINSLGFRGEALYSIAAISDVTLRSKHKSQETGWEIHLRAGKKLASKPCNMPAGTEIEIKELFFNTPARKKFLKTDSTELHQILNVFIPYTILYPDYCFSLTHHNKNLLDLAPAKDKIQRISRLLNLRQEHIFQTNQDLEEISLELILGDINIQRARRDLQFIFINNRPVHNQVISFHMNQVYRMVMPEKTYPFFAVFINMPAQNLDVNVHPTKREVKIKNEQKIVSGLRSLCEQALMSYGKAKQVEQTSIASVSRTYQLEAEPENTTAMKDAPQEQFSFSLTGSINKDSLKNKLCQSGYIGSFMKKYLFFESGTTLLILDQHAAQERVTYEKLINQIESGHIEIQHLLAPVIIKLSPQEMVTWEVLKEKIEKVGFPTTLWDNETIALHSHPLLIKNPEIAVRNLLASEERTRFDKDILARRACRNSLMAGYQMNDQQAQYLQNELVKCKDPFTCPHGRPTVIEIQENVLIKNFLR